MAFKGNLQQTFLSKKEAIVVEVVFLMSLQEVQHSTGLHFGFDLHFI